MAEGDLIGGVVNMGTQVVRVDTLNIAWGWCDMELAASGENGQAANRIPGYITCFALDGNCRYVGHDKWFFPDGNSRKINS